MLGIFNRTTIPALEQTVSFAQRRHDQGRYKVTGNECYFYLQTIQQVDGMTNVVDVVVNVRQNPNLH